MDWGGPAMTEKRGGLLAMISRGHWGVVDGLYNVLTNGVTDVTI